MGGSPIGTLLTFGHGTAMQDEILALLKSAGVAQVVDVRRFPGSRRHPHVATSALEEWLPQAGISYRWEPRLGGRRRLPAEEPPTDPWWQVEAFRAYAAHARTADFRSALDQVLSDAALPGTSTAVMCSESLWWRCHRRLIADVVVLLHGVPVQHLGHDGVLRDHVPAAGARVTASGLRYDKVL